MTKKTFPDVLKAHKIDPNTSALPRIFLDVYAAAEVMAMTNPLNNAADKADALKDIADLAKLLDPSKAAAIDCASGVEIVTPYIRTAIERLDAAVERVFNRAVDQYASLSVTDRRLVESVFDALITDTDAVSTFEEAVNRFSELTQAARNDEDSSDKPADTTGPANTARDAMTGNAELDALIREFKSLGVDVEVHRVV